MKEILQLRFKQPRVATLHGPINAVLVTTSGSQICSRTCFHGNGGVLKDFYGGVAILPRNVCEQWCVSGLMQMGIPGALLERGVCELKPGRVPGV